MPKVKVTDQAHLALKLLSQKDGLPMTEILDRLVGAELRDAAREKHVTDFRFWEPGAIECLRAELRTLPWTADLVDAVIDLMKAGARLKTLETDES